MPAVIENKMQEYGTLIRIDEITKVHDNGEMDIKTTGEKVFRILEVIKEVPEKLYSGAIVTYPDNHAIGNPEMMRRLVNSIRELHRLLNVQKEFKKEDGQLNAYDLAHHIGLTLHEEYDVLHLLDERQRQEYLKRHLAKVIPLIAEMEQLKEKIKLNGHFKNLSSLDLEM